MELLKSAKAIQALEDNAMFKSNYEPILGIIVNNSEYNKYDIIIQKLIKYGDIYKVRIIVKVVDNLSDISFAIQEFNNYRLCCGILVFFEEDLIVQRAIYDLIPRRLDIGCYTTDSIGSLLADSTPIAFRKAPCAAIAVLKLFDYNSIPLFNKRILILGNDLRNGRLLLEILLSRRAICTALNNFPHYKFYDKNYDIIINTGALKSDIPLSLFDFKQYTPPVFVDAALQRKNENYINHIDLTTATKTNLIVGLSQEIADLTYTIIFAKIYNNLSHIINYTENSTEFLKTHMLEEIKTYV